VGRDAQAALERTSRLLCTGTTTGGPPRRSTGLAPPDDSQAARRLLERPLRARAGPGTQRTMLDTAPPARCSAVAPGRRARLPWPRASAAAREQMPRDDGAASWPRAPARARYPWPAARARGLRRCAGARMPPPWPSLALPSPSFPQVAAYVRARARLPFDALSPLAEPQGRRGPPGARGPLHMWGHDARKVCLSSSSLMHRARARGHTPWGARQRLPRAQPAGSRQGPQVECQWWHGMPPPQPCRQAAPARQTGLMHPGMLSVDAVRELVLCQCAHHPLGLQRCHRAMDCQPHYASESTARPRG
jgi:hypothetical protein